MVYADYSDENADRIGELQVEFEEMKPKSAVKLVDADNVEELVRLLHEEAKAI